MASPTFQITSHRIRLPIGRLDEPSVLVTDIGLDQAIVSVERTHDQIVEVFTIAVHEPPVDEDPPIGEFAPTRVEYQDSGDVLEVEYDRDGYEVLVSAV